MYLMNAQDIALPRVNSFFFLHHRAIARVTRENRVSAGGRSREDAFGWRVSLVPPNAIIGYRTFYT